MRTLAIVVSTLLTATVTASQSTLQSDVVRAGRDVYLRECASCHGEAATGYGPASWDLRQRPPDLTRFTDRTVPFPREELRSHITGHIRLQPSHGGTEMPYWRTSLDAASSVPAVTRMDALLDFLNSIQLREFGPYKGPSVQSIAAMGKPLFESFCVSCHGKDGRGQTPVGYTVGTTTDLTAIALRNDGAFELRKVYESIAQCGDRQREAGMPSWNREFKWLGWGDYMTMKNIEAIATYIESIQR
jgi:mono/diheme cytochrome c family protein